MSEFNEAQQPESGDGKGQDDTDGHVFRQNDADQDESAQDEADGRDGGNNVRY